MRIKLYSFAYPVVCALGLTLFKKYDTISVYANWSREGNKDGS